MPWKGILLCIRTLGLCEKRWNSFKNLLPNCFASWFVWLLSSRDPFSYHSHYLYIFRSLSAKWFMHEEDHDVVWQPYLLEDRKWIKSPQLALLIARPEGWTCAKTATAIFVTLGPMPLPTGPDSPAWVRAPLSHVWRVCSAGQRHLKGRITLPFGLFYFIRMTQRKLKHAPGISRYRLFPWACLDLSFRKWTLCYFKSVFSNLSRRLEGTVTKAEVSLPCTLTFYWIYNCSENKGTVHSFWQKYSFGTMLRSSGICG